MNSITKAIIAPLASPDKTSYIYPITKTEAVIDDNNNKLKDILDKYVSYPVTYTGKTVTATNTRAGDHVLPSIKGNTIITKPNPDAEISPDNVATFQSVTNPVFTAADSNGNNNTVTLQTELYSLPSGVCDEYDGITDNLTKKIAKVTFDGNNETWDIGTANGKTYFYHSLENTGFVDSSGTNYLYGCCSHYKWSGVQAGEAGQQCVYIAAYGKTVYVFPADPLITSVQDWCVQLQDWEQFSETPFTIIYELATPTVSTPDIKLIAYDGTTTISCDNTILQDMSVMVADQRKVHSAVDADMLGGKQSSELSPVNHNHDGRYAPLSTLTHSKNGTVHSFAGLLETGIYTAQFEAVADYEEGDTFAGYTVIVQGGDTVLPSKVFVAGDLVSVVVDAGVKKLGFKMGGAPLFGSALPQDVLRGKTFMSEANKKQEGILEVSRGNYITSNCEAWTIRISAADNNWTSVYYGNGLFIAVASSGAGNRVMTSLDGITWTIRTSATDSDWRSVCYGNGLFVAVAQTGTGGRVMTSPDGINWMARIPATLIYWNSVCYGNGLFVAVAESGTGKRVMTSPDGITWTARTSAADNSWRSVCYGNGLFVAVAFNGTGNRVMTSTDGINWTGRTTPVDNYWYSVCYGNGLFVAVSYSGTNDRVMTSPDGINWTARTSAADNAWSSVCYGNGLFVAVASSGTGNRVMTSPDGINWTSKTSASNNNWVSVCYGNGLFVAVAETGTGGLVMTSYVQRQLVETAPKVKSVYLESVGRTAAVDNEWNSVCCGNGLFVAISGSGTGNRVMTSPDGINWTIRTSAANNRWKSVCYGNGLFVAVSETGTGNRVMTSPDGIAWTPRTTPVDNGWVSVCYGKGLFVAVSYNGTGNGIMTSPDGINWAIRASAADNQWRSVCYGKGLFVAVSYNSTGNGVMASLDGINWTIRTSAANNNWYSVCYGSGLFVAVATSGSGNRVMTSSDGINWTIRTSAADNNWESVCYGNGLFVAVAWSGTGNRVMTSPDGINWTLRTSAADNYWYSVCYGNGLFVAVANSGASNRVMTIHTTLALDE